MSYSVSGTSTAGCISQTSAIASISVNPNPTVTVLNGSICIGDSFTISPSGANTFTVSGGNTVVSPTTTTSYSVSGTNTTGCISTTPAIATITVYTLPIISASVSTSLICIGQQATLSAVGAMNYSWTPNIPLNSIVSPTLTTTYSVTGYDANNCSNTSAITLSVDACTGLYGKNDPLVNKILVVPNPSNGLFTILMNSTLEETSVDVFDETGKFIFSKKINDHNTNVDLRNYANGLYYLKLMNGTKKETIIIIKE
jgi:hypothetical protein